MNGDDRTVGIVAVAICEANGKVPNDAMVRRYHKFANAAIGAHLKALTDAGYVIVPPPSGRVNEHDRKITTRAHGQ